MSIIEVDYHIELSSIRDFVNGYIQSNNAIPFIGHGIFESMKKAVIGSEIMPFLFAPTDGKPDNYYDKYVRLENEYSLKSIPDFFSHEGNFYDLDKKLNINIYNVDDLIFQQLFSIKMIEIDDKKIKLTDFLNFQLYDNFFGNKELFANFLQQLLSSENFSMGVGSKTPRFYDGSIGGQSRIFAKPFQPSTASTQQNRINAGAAAGYADGAAIIGGLDKGETIKIITNSMGAAFERGFTKGILKYQTEENERRTTFNAGIDKMLAPLQEQQQFLNEMSKASEFMQADGKQKLAGDLSLVNSKINELTAKKKEILNVKIEMVIDLSSHETNYPDPNAQKSFYMMAPITGLESFGGLGVKQSAIAPPAIQIGLDANGNSLMTGHHSSHAPPSAMPESSTKPKPPNK